jgi:hypothetical protein
MASKVGKKARKKVGASRVVVKRQIRHKKAKRQKRHE